MRSTWKALLLVAVVAATVPVFATPAIAAVPSNDREAGAVVVDVLPFTHAVDTTEATRGGPRICSNRASVFYKFTPAETARIQVDLIGSDYDTTLAAYTRDDAGRAVRIGCDDYTFSEEAPGLRLRAEGGTTYVFMAGGRRDERGHLQITVTEVDSAPLDYAIEVGTTGAVDAGTGVVTLSGSVTCTERSWVYVEGHLRQLRNGIFIARSYWWTAVVCTPGSPIPLTLELESDSSVAFGPGAATMQVTYSSSGDGWNRYVNRGEEPASAIQLA